MKLHLPEFVLASASPRRRDLLARAGHRFEVDPSSVDESQFATVGVYSERYCMELARAKAAEVADRRPDRLVMGADTVVDFDGQIVGKPADANDARRIVRMLFSAPHKVITGLALIRRDRKIELVRSAVTVVFPRALTDEQVEAHIRSGDWEGKAGAYGIQECGDEFVERIEGSFTNVMGLPMELVEEMLKLTIEY
ncbi:MAG: septum formation protein Maf [Phycisphaerae bacterium]|nr:septum formation protein Maf [Phycisphaerae bacterium]